jgi:carboxymethylenebutenolidase
MAKRSVEAGGKVDVVLYPGATHGFDDFGRRRQSIPANRLALEDALKRAIAFVERLRD